MNRRTHLTPNQQFRSQLNEDGSHTITGYAALYSVLSNELYPGVREKIAPGAFDAALPTSDVVCNINHSNEYLLGRTSSGTLRLSSDALGLKFDVQLPDTSYARDLGELMKRGDLSECSFAFTVDPDNIDVERVSETDSVETIRSVTELFDVSVVTRGAYSQTFSLYRSHEDTTELANAVVMALAKQNPKQNSESRTAEKGETQAQKEHKFNSAAVQIALLELQFNSIEV